MCCGGRVECRTSDMGLVGGIEHRLAVSQGASGIGLGTAWPVPVAFPRNLHKALLHLPAVAALVVVATASRSSGTAWPAFRRAAKSSVPTGLPAYAGRWKQASHASPSGPASSSRQRSAPPESCRRPARGPLSFPAARSCLRIMPLGSLPYHPRESDRGIAPATGPGAPRLPACPAACPYAATATRRVPRPRRRPRRR
jgi:hypothetical protein